MMKLLMMRKEVLPIKQSRSGVDVGCNGDNGGSPYTPPRMAKALLGME
jgi:hypothetical protein